MPAELVAALRLLGRRGVVGLGPVEIEDPGRIVLVLGSQRARQLVVTVCLGVLSLLLERPPERVVRVVIGRRELEHHPKLFLRLLVALDPQVSDPERLADRGLARLATLGLLERDSRLRRPSLAE